MLCRELELGVTLDEVAWESCFREVTFKLDRIGQDRESEESRISPRFRLTWCTQSVVLDLCQSASCHLSTLR